MEMKKCKTEQLEDGNATENAVDQVKNAAGNADAQMPNEAQNVVGGQMLNNAENAVNQMPNEAQNVANEMPNVVEANNDGQMNNTENDDGGQMLDNAEIADRMQNENEAIAPIEEEVVVANPRKRYKCSKCSARFGSNIGLRGHGKIHKRRGNPSYPINCQLCDASFAAQNALVQHQRAHQVEMQPKAKLGRDRPSTKRNRPQANNDGAEEDDELEIIEPIKQEPVGPRRFPRAANNELAQNAVGPSVAAGPSSISSILKECAKSHSFTIHNVNAVVGTMGKIEFQCKPGPSSSR